MEKEQQSNLELWDKVRTPDPRFTKQFNRGGGFKGTGTNTQYIIQKATELWGVNGAGWGVEIDQEQYVEGGPLIMGEERVGVEIIHVLRGHVWYIDINGEKQKTSQQYGQTTFVGKNKYGPFTDEEAPKKSVTDMMLKCLSLLGFSADIFLGLWDDNKYVNDAKKKFEEPTTLPKKSAAVWMEEADKNDKDLKTLGEWYTANKQAITAMPKKDQSIINSHVTRLKHEISNFIMCPDGKQRVDPDECKLADCCVDCKAFAEYSKKNLKTDK